MSAPDNGLTGCIGARKGATHEERKKYVHLSSRVWGLEVLAVLMWALSGSQKPWPRRPFASQLCRWQLHAVRRLLLARHPRASPVSTGQAQHTLATRHRPTKQQPEYDFNGPPHNHAQPPPYTGAIQPWSQKKRERGGSRRQRRSSSRSQRRSSSIANDHARLKYFVFGLSTSLCIKNDRLPLAEQKVKETFLDRHHLLSQVSHVEHGLVVELFQQWQSVDLVSTADSGNADELVTT